ncbi:MAG: hypothetical protein ACOYNL_00925 [Rickettsiales bacterium]
MKSKPQGIEALTIRRAAVADADKVRYRVYSTPAEFIAVIAESALMAVKVSGIPKPHKIVRDLPTEGITVNARKMAAMDANAVRVSLQTHYTEQKKQLVVDIKTPETPEHIKAALFRPMNIGDLQHKGQTRARILPPEMVNEIIEKHTKATMPTLPTTQQEQPTLAEAPPEPPLDPKERLMQMAQEMPASPSEPPNKELSPEEVEKLLNG